MLSRILKLFLIYLFLNYSAFGQENHLLLGNPSNADNSHSNNYLISKPQYILSYNADEGKPNWVSWHLDHHWIGQVDRQDDFRSDELLPSSFYHVSKSDYDNSGFDRGHNCPSKDRSNNVDNNSATFLMDNMMPQAPRNNRVTWKKLEEYCRDLVEEGNELYIICGSYGKGGIGSKGYAESINKKITVPQTTWKIILILPEGENDLIRVRKETISVIAVEIPNSNEIQAEWSVYSTSVREIEHHTGYNFLSNLDQQLQDEIESLMPTNLVFSKENHLENSTTPTNLSNSNSSQHTYYRGSKGGCYYLNSNGKKIYVDKSLCN
jgi:endonuclease G, mitochondrial